MRQFLRVTALSAGLVMTIGCQTGGSASPSSAQSAAPAEPYTFQLDFLPSGVHAGFYYALDQGYYEEVGLDVTIVPGRGSGDTVNLVAAGQADIGYADLSAVIGSIANDDAQVVAIGALLRRPPHSIMYRTDAGITEPTDLAGKDVGTSPGNAVEILFPFFAENAGLDPATVNFTSMDPGALGPSLISGQIDGANLFVFNLAAVEPSAKEEGVELGQLNFSDYGLEVFANSIIAHKDRVADSSDRLRAFLSATYRAYQEIFTDAAKLDEAAAAMKRAIPDGSEEIFRHGIEIAEPYIVTEEVVQGAVSWGEFEADRMEETRDLYTDALDLQREVVVDDIYTNDLLP
jgi:NitT/TauT family transport system substrate-binding protein